MYDVVIVGAGLTGLTTAYKLLRLQKPGLSILVLEKDCRTGGLIKTINVDGFRVEGGANSFSRNDVSVMNLCKELDVQPVESSATANKRYIFHNNRLYPVPSNIVELMSSGMLTFKTGLNIFKQQLYSLIKGKFDHNSLTSLLLRDILDPFLIKIYFDESKPDSITGKINNSSFFSFKDGMETLIQRISELIPSECIRMRVHVCNILREENRFVLTLSDGSHVTTEALVIATAAWSASDLLQNVYPDLAEELKKITPIPLSVIHFGFANSMVAKAKNGFGFLVSRNTQSSLLASVWMSNLFPDCAPSGYSLFSCYATPGLSMMTGEISTDDEEISRHVLESLSYAFGQYMLKPSFTRVLQYKNALPYHKQGQLIKYLESVNNSLPGLFWAGNYLNGLSLNSCIKSGEDAAQNVLQYIVSRSSVL